MPTFSNPMDLYTYIVANIGPNGTQAITGVKHQEVMLSTMLSILNIVASLPGQTVNDFPAWDGGETYEGESEVVVRHNNKLWLFVSAADVLGTEPGTNGLVWQEISAVQLAHFRNKDQALDEGGPYESSASDIRALLDSALAWHGPVDEAYQSAPFGTETVGYRCIVSGGSDVFEGHDDEIAQLGPTGWSFTQTAVGHAAIYKLGAIMYRTDAGWQLFGLQTPGLASVLATAPATGNYAILVNRPIADASVSVAHNSPGTLELNMLQSRAINVNLSADVTLSWSAANFPTASTWFISLNAISTDRAFALASGKWRRLDGLTIPSTIPGGSTWMLQVRGPLGVGNPVIVSCDEVITV